MLDDGEPIQQTKVQQWLWQCWLDYWDTVRTLTEENDATLWVIVNGDLVDGDHHDTRQIVSRNASEMIEAAVEILWPVKEMADELFVIRGTPAHTGHSGQHEEIVARELDANKNGAKYSWWNLQCQTDGGLLLDVAHHGRVGKQPHTIANAMGQLVAKELIYAQLTGRMSADLMVRSHNHQIADTGETYEGIRAISLPAWQLKTEYINILDSSAIAHIGGFIAVCNGRDYDLIPKRYKPKPNQPWRRDGNTRRGDTGRDSFIIPR